MKRLLILIAILIIGCAESGGESSGRIAAPKAVCLDGLEAVWWIDQYDGSLNFENQTGTTHHEADTYWLKETFIIQWNCNYDLDIDKSNHLIIKTFEDDNGWTLTDTQVLDPECTCGGNNEPRP
jgi:hypothetical protein